MGQFTAYLRRHHLALLALFIALGGTSYAAINLPKNSVGPRQLRKSAVTNAKVASNAVTGAKVKNRSLSGADLRLETIGVVPHASTADNALHAIVATSADQLAGAPASSFAQAPRFAVVDKGGTILEQSGGITVTPLTGLPGFYDVAFGSTLEGKSVQATPTSTLADAAFRGAVLASFCGITTTCGKVANDKTHVLVVTQNSANAMAEEHAFIVTVQ
jgi:hypothetical protein